MRDPTIRNVIVLAFCQALANIAMTMNMTVTALAGKVLAVDPSLATLPLGLQFTATMAMTIPASLLMKRIGRRGGFAIGAGIGVVGAGTAAAALFAGSFALFIAGSILIGAFMGFVSFYRYAAADTASEAFKSRAISLVLAGGVIAALISPTLADKSFQLLSPVTFSGTYVGMMVIMASIWGLLLFVRIPPPTAAERGDSGRPLTTIIAQPVFLVAAGGAMIGYGSMTFVMTATPLAMVACGYVFTDTTSVIQWHVLGMFVPSFFTGHLIARFGVLRIMLIGALALAAAGVINQSGIELVQFYAGLILLGIGGNFLYIGGSTFLTECYAPAEKAKVQGFFDFMIFASSASASFLAGALQHVYGWQVVNWVVLPLIAVAGILIVTMMVTRKRAAGISTPVA